MHFLRVQFAFSIRLPLSFLRGNIGIQNSKKGNSKYLSPGLDLKHCYFGLDYQAACLTIPNIWHTLYILLVSLTARRTFVPM